LIEALRKNHIGPPNETLITGLSFLPGIFRLVSVQRMHLHESRHRETY